ncbi:MAG: ARMT1-like domain-containing protein, partial [Sulfurimonas sp.]|nr:ARMT1-like domain-containing protein [Sulfurimonas sp.]
DKLCNLVDSGVNTPGFTYNRANEISRNLFDSVDVGRRTVMGNYECLNESKHSNIFFLLKVKCDVVANSLGKRLGDIICKKKEEF